jgi:hypothetical protein
MFPSVVVCFVDYIPAGAKQSIVILAGFCGRIYENVKISREYFPSVLGLLGVKQEVISLVAHVTY